MNWRKVFDRKQADLPAGVDLPFKRSKTITQGRRVKVQHTRSIMAQMVESDVGISFHLRAMVAMWALTILFATMGARLVYVAFMPPAEPRASIREMPVEPGRRGNIYDRNGVLLAATLKTYSLYADPKRILDAEEAVVKLRRVFPELGEMELLQHLSDPSRRFVWLKRKMTPAEAAAINAQGIPGIYLRDEYVRIYPLKELASHILGAVDVDGRGIAGIERSQNATLAKGDDVTLALDVRVQDLLRQSVLEAKTMSEAPAAWGVVLDAAHNGILGMVSLPDYDPNHFGKYPDEARFNRVALASYEMGSTFKLFTMALGLADGKITPDTKVDCRYPIKIDRFTIKDYHAKKAILTATEILRYSSNIGAATIADMSGAAKQKEFMGKLGMLEPLNVGLPEIGPVRYPNNWGRIQTLTISFGHGMMVTPLHLVAATAALVTDGNFRVPHVLKEPAETVAPRKALEMPIVQQVRDLMRDVVHDGSGKSSAVAGYDIGGKTGTAEKISGRGYSKDKNVVSFVAAVPLTNPQYVILIMVDEPKKGFETGGRIAAPSVGRFLERWAMVDSIEPNYDEVKRLKGFSGYQTKWMRYSQAAGVNEPTQNATAAPEIPNEGTGNEAIEPAATEH